MEEIRERVRSELKQEGRSRCWVFLMIFSQLLLLLCVQVNIVLVILQSTFISFGFVGMKRRNILTLKMHFFYSMVLNFVVSFMTGYWLVSDGVKSIPLVPLYASVLFCVIHIVGTPRESKLIALYSLTLYNHPADCVDSSESKSLEPEYVVVDGFSQTPDVNQEQEQQKQQTVEQGQSMQQQQAYIMPYPYPRMEQPYMYQYPQMVAQFPVNYVPPWFYPPTPTNNNPAPSNLYNSAQ